MTPGERAKAIFEKEHDFVAMDFDSRLENKVAAAIEAAVLAERARAARIARESVAADLSEKFPDARRLAEQIAADIEGDQK